MYYLNYIESSYEYVRKFENNKSVSAKQTAVNL